MKKIYLSILSMTIITSAVAGFTPSGGFKGPGVQTVTVKQIMDMKDDTNVILQGNIIEKTDTDKYTFKDDTGIITVEIDKKDWRGVEVTPEDKVEIMGEIDKNDWKPWKKTEIEVDIIRKI